MVDMRWRFIVAVLAALWTNTVAGKSARDRNEKPYRFVCVKGGYPEDQQPDYLKDVDYSLCTHVIHEHLRAGGYTEDRLDFEDYGIDRDFRKKYPNVTQLLSWMNWANGEWYTYYLMDENTRKEVIDSLVRLLTKFDLDGLDLTWFDFKMPSYGDVAGVMNKGNFTVFVKELRKGFDKHGFLLTASVSGIKQVIDYAYDVPELVKNLDFINIQAFEYYGYNPSSTHHQAALDSAPEEQQGEDRFRNVKFSVDYWLQLGVKPENLVLGMTSVVGYFILKDAKVNGPGAPVSTIGTEGFNTSTFGFLDYTQFCQGVKEGNWTVVRNQHWGAPYTFQGDKWIAYEDETSVALKVDLLLEKKLGGAMVDLIEGDDPQGRCGPRHPLSNVIVDKLTKASLRPKMKCTRGGFFEDPDDCTTYYECVSQKQGYRLVVHKCRDGTGYDSRVKNCVNKNRIANCH